MARIIIIVIIIIAVFFTPITKAQSESPYTVTVSPALQELFTANISQGTITIDNTSNTNLSISAKISNIGINNQDKIIILDESDTSQLEKFISLSETEFIINSNEQKTVTISLKNVSDLPAGSTYGSIIFTLNTTDTITETTSVVPSIASHIIITKSGTANFNASISNISFARNGIVFDHPDKILMDIENEGNAIFQPFGSIEVYDTLNRLVYRGQITEDVSYLFPKQEKTISGDLYRTDYVFPIGRHTLVVAGNIVEDQQPYFYRGNYFYFDPLFGSLTLGILIIGIVLTGILIRSLTKIKIKNIVKNK